jgi:catechol 2,3-dioxygenase-like lactoylglutathione lyase family enzyme
VIRLESIDHVALAVRDVEASARWYVDVLGLSRLHQDVWGSFPAVVGAGGTALALFPMQGERTPSIFSTPTGINWRSPHTSRTDSAVRR